MSLNYPRTYPEILAGHSYRLLRNCEVRVEQTGTLKEYYPKGTVLKVEKVVPELERVYVEGGSLPIPLDTLRRMVEEIE